MKLKKNLSSKWVKRLKDFYFVGCYVGEELILHEENEEIGSVLKIKCLSPIPEKLTEYMESYAFVFSCDVYHEANERYFKRWLGIRQDMDVESVTNFLANKHLLFQLYVEKGQLFVEVIENVPCYQEEYYFLIPTPVLRKTLTKEDLEYRLEKGYLPIQFAGYNNEYPSPPVLYYEGTLYGNIRLKSTVNPYTYVSLMNSVLFMNIEEDWHNIVSFHLQHLAFVRASVYNKIVRELITGGKRLKVDQHQDGKYGKEETEFLLTLQHNLLAERIFLEDKDIVTFHLSVKTNTVTMLSGPPGVGKSNLAQIYGESLGLRIGTELLVVPVSPSYGEPMDILGYMHPETGTYFESETGIVSLLREAEKNKDSLYMILFEEMNLSQIEFWFAPFISILEQKCDCRHLRLFSDDDESGIIEIGDNVIFVGTINMDDTTKPLSPRFLDRVNLVSLRPLTFKEIIERSQSVTIDHKLNGNITYTQFKHEWLVQTNGFQEFAAIEVEFIDKLNQIFRKHIGQDGLSLRSGTKMIDFLHNVPTTTEGTPYFQRQEAFDMQMKQRVLSKLGFLKQEAGLITVHSFLDETMDLLRDARYKEVSEFHHSLQVMKDIKWALESM